MLSECILGTLHIAARPITEHWTPDSGKLQPSFPMRQSTPRDFKAISKLESYDLDQNVQRYEELLENQGVDTNHELIWM